MTYPQIGQVPPEETCVQVGTIGYEEKAQLECERYIRKLREFFGEEPENTQLRVKGFPHDFGTYYEVICYYDPDNKSSINYAFKCEGHGPKTWIEQPRRKSTKSYAT